jgi:cell division protease FtsH
LNSTVKTLLLWTALFVVVILLWKTFQEGRVTRRDIDFSEFLESVAAGQVKEVTIRGDKLVGTFRQGDKGADGEQFATQLIAYPDLVKELRQAGVRIRAEEPKEGTLFTLLVSWGPMIVIVVLWLVFMRRSGGSNRASHSEARPNYSTPRAKVTFRMAAEGQNGW